MSMKYWGQMLAAFLGAAFVANALCYFYYSPAVQTDNPASYTECKSESSIHNPHGTEGYGTAVIDDNGFNNANLFPWREAEILCVGSSQTEAQHINWDENYVYLLNQMHPEAKVYNLGVSAQSFANSIYRIPALKENFPDCRVIIFEINSWPSAEQLEVAQKYMETGEIPARDLSWKRGNVLLSTVGHIPLCRLLWSQYDNSRKTKAVASAKSPQVLEDNYKDLVRETLVLAKKQAGNTQLIIFYLSQGKINRDGAFQLNDTQGKSEAIRDACQELGITFVDMGSTYLDHYDKQRLLPYGFWNSKVGSGHLNAQGHKMIAETLSHTLKKEGICP